MRRVIHKDGSAFAGPCICTPAQAIAVSKHRSPRGAGAWLLLAALAVAVLAVSACADAGAAQEPMHSAIEIHHAASAARACPPGHAVVWIDAATMECMRERQ